MSRRTGLETCSVYVPSAEELIEQMHREARLFAQLPSSLGSIALLVGRIGVMNVMLFSVTEQRSEIGIRRAFGARRTDIESQFLIEAVILSLVGGLVGIAAGTAGIWGICSCSGWTFDFSPLAAGFGIGMATGSGVFFGFYPAWQAVWPAPVAALRGIRRGPQSERMLQVLHRPRPRLPV